MRHRSYPPVDREHSLLALGVVLSLTGLTMTMCDARLTRAAEPLLPGAPGQTARTGPDTAEPVAPGLQRFVVGLGGSAEVRVVTVTAPAGVHLPRTGGPRA